MNFLEEKIKKKEHLSKDMILKVQEIVEKGASKEKIGLRGPMPPGVLFAVYDPDEYYSSLQMGLPALYYSGRDNPTHPEIWINYFLKMMALYSRKVYELSKASEEDELAGSFSYLNTKEKEFLAFLLKKKLYEFTPIEVSRMIGVTNKTVINRCAKLVNQGFLVPVIVKTRIRSYRLSDFARTNEKEILKKMR